jgi:hypothetical protein
MFSVTGRRAGDETETSIAGPLVRKLFAVPRWQQPTRSWFRNSIDESTKLTLTSVFSGEHDVFGKHASYSAAPESRER